MLARKGSELRVFSSAVRGGEGAGIQLCNSHLLAAHATVSDNNGAGLLLAESRAFLEDSYVQRNSGPAVLMSRRLELSAAPADLATSCFVQSPSLGVKLRLTLNRPSDGTPTATPTKNWLAISHCDINGNTLGFLGESAGDLESEATFDGAKISDLSSVVNEVYVRKSVGDAQATAAFSLHRWPARSPRSSRLSLASQSREEEEDPSAGMEVDRAEADAEAAHSVAEEEDMRTGADDPYVKGHKRGRMTSSSEDDWMVGSGGTSAEPSPRAEG